MTKPFLGKVIGLKTTFITIGKIFLQSTYGRLLLEVANGNNLQNRCSEVISIYKDEHVGLHAY